MQGMWRAVSLAALGAAAFPLGLSAQTAAPAGGAAAGAGASSAAARMLADQLVDEAFGYTRDPKEAKAQSSLRASLLLEFANRLDPSDARILKLLVEASQVAGRKEVQRNALRSLIKTDPGDMVAQVEYLDFLADATQALDERARVYQSALETQSLDPTVRSEMAVRLARIAEERGDAAGARTLLGQALKLNDVNVRALREWVRMTEKTPDERVRALAALVTADPYQPEAWLALARLLESAGLHARAADALSTTIEQSQKDGGQPPADMFQELAVELAISARRAEAAPIIDALAKLPDAPVSALVAARLIANEYVAVPGSLTGSQMPATAPATQPATAASQPRRAIGFIDVPPPPPTLRPGELDYTMLLRRKLLEDMKSKTPESLAEGAWVELSVMPEPSRDVAGWLDDYAKAVGKGAATDKTLARLRGWLLLRNGKAAEALAALTPLADADPLAQLGVARALIDLHRSADAARQLQDLWRQYPQGIFALQVAQAARSAQIPLADTTLGTQYAGVIAAIPQEFWVAQRQPRDLELISPDDLDPRYNLGQPILLNLTITNVSNHPLPVGPDGAIKTTVGVVGVVGAAGGMGKSEPLGMYALENLQRVYRLAPRGQISASIRLDQGRLGSMFTSQPMNSFALTISLITAPRGTPEKPEYGLGGQVVTVQPPGVTHVGIPLTPETANAELDTVFRAISNGTPEQQLDAIAVASALLATLPPPGNDPAAKVEVVRKMLCSALLPPLRSPSAITRAWTLRYLPATGLTPDLAGAVQALNDDPDPVVRAAWATNEVVLGESVPGQKDAAIQAIRQQEGMEADPIAKAWMGTILNELVAPASQPATRP